MWNTILGTVVILLIMGMPFWVGYRLGLQRGLAAWQKSYRHMTADDVRHHKKIINAMPDKA